MHVTKHTKLITRFTLTVILSLSVLMLMSQNDTSSISRNNFIKINLISLPPLINNLNQKWIGLEYQRIINEKVSFSVTTDFGIFEDYTYIKYHDFFDEGQGFSYTREDVRIPGYHIIPSLRYIFIRPFKKANINIYTAVNLDYYQYFMNKDIYQSITGQTTTYHNSTIRFNIGGTIGAQYIAFNRVSLDLNVSLFTKLYSKSTSDELPELYPENSFWRSDNNSTWATINLMLGYKFGCNKDHRKTKIQ